MKHGPGSLFIGKTSYSAFASGTNGLTFVDAKKRDIVKVSWVVFVANGWLRGHESVRHLARGHGRLNVDAWNNALGAAGISPNQVREMASMRRTFWNSAPALEARGALLAASAGLPAAPVRFVTSDGWGLRRRFVKGVSIEALLHGRAGVSDATLAALARLWRKTLYRLVARQGIGVDIINPGNIIVHGSSLTLIDLEPLSVDARARRYLRSAWGIAIPTPRSKPIISWPFVPEQIVCSSLWRLPFSKAVRFVQHLRNETRNEAIARIAVLPIFRVGVNANILDSRHVERARLLAQTRTRKDS